MCKKKKIFVRKEYKIQPGGILDMDFMASIIRQMLSDQYGFFHSKTSVIYLDTSVCKSHKSVQGWDLGYGNVLTRDEKIIECTDFYKKDNMLYLAYAYPHVNQCAESKEAYDVFLYSDRLDRDNEDILYDAHVNWFDKHTPQRIFAEGCNANLEFQGNDAGTYLTWIHKSNTFTRTAMRYTYNIATGALVSLPAADGLYIRTIDAFINNIDENIIFYKYPGCPDFYIIVLPPQIEDKKSLAGAIVVCLGGPEIDIPSFNDPDSIYAKFRAGGFYVIVPLRRGVKGISKEWEEGIMGNYGTTDVDDILKGTAFVLSKLQHRIDQNKIGIYGASYGGYTALLSVCRSSLYKAAVSHCGMSDLIRYPYECSGNASDIMQTYSGKTIFSEFQAFAEEISPLYNVKFLNSPVLFVHSIDDRSVWFGQSVRTYNECVRLHIDAELILTPGSHSYDIPNADNLIDYIIKFYCSKLNVL